MGSFINDYMRIPSTSDSECNEACKIGEHLDIKNCSCEKILFHKLVWTCEDDILNTTETSLHNKIVICTNNCPRQRQLNFFVQSVRRIILGQLLGKIIITMIILSVRVGTSENENIVHQVILITLVLLSQHKLHMKPTTSLYFVIQ